MAYVEGFVLAVPTARQEDYRRQAAAGAPLFHEFGATRMVESWGDDVPDGEVTDFRRAVQATADETVVFSWFEYPSRAVRDAANAKIISDPRMQALGTDMPFDGKRMVYGGFAPILDEGGTPRGSYFDGYLVPVPTANQAAYRDMAAKAAALFRQHGALRVVECWEDDVADGKLTDFRRAVQISGDEKVVFSWVEWPSKAARMAGWEKIEADPLMQPGAGGMPFDGKRLVYGGFVPLLDTGA